MLLATFLVIKQFNKIASSEDIKLRSLGSHYSDLSHISPHVLADALLRLEYVDLGYTKLTLDQVHTIFDEIANCETFKLNELNLSWSNLLDPT